MSREGISLIGEAMDGNTSDKVWNRRIIEELVSKLASDLGGLIYVADSAVYKCKDYTAEIDGRPYRLIVVHSSKLDKGKASKLERDLFKQKAELDEKIAELGAVEFACEPDAQAAPNRLKQECFGSFYDVSGRVEAEEVVLKRARRGRPGK